MAKNEVEIVSPRPFDKFVAYLQERATVEPADVEANVDELVAKQVDNILTAESEDALWAAMELAGLLGFKDIESGTRIIIHGYKVVIGGLAKRTGVYIVIDATDPDTGAQLALDTGVERIVAFCRMVETGSVGLSFPVEVQVFKKKTQGDNELITLRRVARRPVQSTAE